MMIIGREGADIDDGTVISKKEAGGRGNTAAASSAASSRSWSRLKDPRIVRVSRAFGGKDRHSKVCTVRGLRDRRVRLSVPTAIQLYDLQDRLGLNQPSKVVDWLLNAAKHEIDELPPLQMPPNSSSSSGNFLTHHHHNFQPLMLASNNSHHHQLQRPMKIGNSSTNWDGDGDDDDNDNSILRTKAKEEVEEEDDSAAATRESNVAEEDNNNNNISNNSNHVSFVDVSPSTNFFSSRNSSTPTNGGLGLLNNISSAHHQSQQQPYSSLIRWDPSTLSLAQSQPQSHPVVTNDFHSNFNVVSLGSGPLQHHPVLVYQPAAAAQSYFPSHINAANANEYAPKQINFQMLMSSNSTNSVDNSNSLTQAANEGRPFHLTTNFLPTTQKD